MSRCLIQKRDEHSSMCYPHSVSVVLPVFPVLWVLLPVAEGSENPFIWGNVEFSGLHKIEILSSDALERFPCVSDDGLQIYFQRWVDETCCIWTATRASRDDEFGEPYGVSELCPPSSGILCFVTDFLSPDDTFIFGLAYETSSARMRNGDPAIRSRPFPSSAFGPPEYDFFVNVKDDSKYEQLSGLSSNGLELFFAKGHETVGVDYRLYRSTRASTSEAFSVPVLLDQFGSGDGGASRPRITPDDLVLFFREGERPSTVLQSAVRSSAGEEFVRARGYHVGVDIHGYDFTPDLEEFYFADGEGVYRAYTREVSAVPSHHWQNYSH
jgi:hypothetical protein